MTRSDIDRSERSLWRDAASLPLTVSNPISLRQGCTLPVRRRVAEFEALFQTRMNETVDLRTTLGLIDRCERDDPGSPAHPSCSTSRARSGAPGSHCG